MYKKTAQSTTRWAIGSAALVAIILLYVLWANPGTPPADFLEARIQAVGSVNNLAQLVNNSLANLERVNTFVRNGNDIEARTLINYEFENRKEKQNAAIVLANNLEHMAKAVSGVNASAARVEAVQAVTSGISMVSRMVSYSGNLDQLFAAISEKTITGKYPANTNISGLASNLNADAAAINTLSKEFNDALKQFDEEYGIQ